MGIVQVTGAGTGIAEGDSKEVSTEGSAHPPNFMSLRLANA